MDCTIGGQTVTLEMPGSYAARTDIVLASGDDVPVRILAAALGVCWRGEGRPKVDYFKTGCRPLVYGGQVLDALSARGLKYSDIIRAGRVAYDLLSESVAGTLLTEDEVRAAEDFFAPTTEASKP